MLFLACVCECGVIAAPSEAQRVVLDPVASEAGALPPAIPDDLAVAYALGFEWWQANRSHDALRAFHTVIDKLSHGKEHVEAGADAGWMRVRDHVITRTEGGVLLASASSGRLERFLPVGKYAQPTKLGAAFVGLQVLDAVALLDADRAVVTERIEHASTLVRGTSLFAVYGGPHLEVWSLAGPKRLFTVHDTSPVTSVSLVTFTGGERYVVGLDGIHGVVVDVATGERIVSYETNERVSATNPGVAADGYLLAYGHVGNTYLFDEQTRKVIGMSHVVKDPRSYAFGGGNTSPWATWAERAFSRSLA